MNDALLTYIKNALTQGYSQESIETLLLEHGYEHSDIQKAFLQISKQQFPKRFLVLFSLIALFSMVTLIITTTHMLTNTSTLPITTVSTDTQLEETQLFQNNTEQIIHTAQTQNETSVSDLPLIDCQSTTFFMQNIPLIQRRPQDDEAIMCFSQALQRCQQATIHIALQEDIQMRILADCSITASKQNQSIHCPKPQTQFESFNSFFYVFQNIEKELSEIQHCSIQ